MNLAVANESKLAVITWNTLPKYVLRLSKKSYE